MPYNPGVEYRGDQYLFQGITGAANQLTEGIKKWKDERKAKKELDSTLDTLGSVVGDLVKRGDLPPGVLQQYTQIRDGTSEQKAGFVKALGTGFGMLSKAQEDARAKEYLDMQRDRIKQEAIRQATVGRYNQLLAEYVKPKREHGGVRYPVELSPKLTPEVATRLAAEAGVAEPGDVNTALRAGQFAKPEQVPQEYKASTGETFVFLNGQMVRSTPQNPMGTGEPLPARPIPDPEGNIIAYGIPDGKGGERVLKNTAKQLMHEDGSDVEGMPGYKWFGDRLVPVDFATALQAEMIRKAKLGGQTNAPPAGGKPIRLDSRGNVVPY